MKILQLCKKFPFPLKDGESIAVTYLSNALYEQGCEITLLSMNTTKHFTDLSSLPPDFNHYKAIYVTPLDNKVRAFDAFKNLFSNDSYHVSRFISKDFEDKLIELLKNEKYDVVQLETLYLAPYIDIIKKHSKALVTMRAHNVEFEIWERIASNTTFLPKKWYLKYLTEKLKKFELGRLNDYDYLIAVSERDLKKFKNLGYKNGAMASPIGLNLGNYVNLKPAKTFNSMCFIGALDWMPNLEGLEWFLDKAWPMISMRFPNIEFHIAGRNTPSHLKDFHQKNIMIHGEVDNAIDFINQHSIMIVPLFSGSGMRVKILEGMALGKIVITTTLGKEGIEAIHGEHLLIADNPAAFVEAIEFAQSNPEMMSAISKNAIQFVEDFYDHNNNAQLLLTKYKELKSNPKYIHQAQ
ncbi:MAG: glycosyltransferase family 4 protein [Saprospiraceae bacterium]